LYFQLFFHCFHYIGIIFVIFIQYKAIFERKQLNMRNLMQHKINTLALSPLPDKIFQQIILYLTVSEARIASFVTKKWRTKINAHSSFWNSKLALHFPQEYYAPEETAIPIPAEQWKAKLARKYTKENNSAGTQKTSVEMLQRLRSWRECPELIMPVLAQVTYEQLGPFLAWLVKQGKQELLDHIYITKSKCLKSKIELAIKCHQPTTVLQEVINNHGPCDLTNLLFIAAETDHCDAIDMILELGSELNLYQQSERSYIRISPIEAAIKRGSIAFIKKLIAENATKTTEKQLLLSLSLAILSGNIEAVKLTYDLMGANLNEATTGKTPLHIAIEMDKEEAVDFLLSRNVPLDAVDVNGNTPAFFAASHGRLEMLKQLKNAGANMHWRNSAGDTLLHAAVRERGCFIVLKWLVTEKIIDINSRNKEEKTALHITSESIFENTVILEYLINSGIAVSVEDINHRQPLHLAVTAKNYHNTKKLLESGAGINAQDKDRNTPLHHAVQRSNTRMYRNEITRDIIEYLINQGASTTLRNGLGMTPPDVALEEGYGAALRRFFPANTDTKEKPRANYIDLHNAAKAGKNRCIQQLLANGVDIDAADLEGRTALHVAVIDKKLNTAKYLIGKGACKGIRDRGGKLARDYLSEHMGGYIPLLTPDRDNTPLAAASNRVGDFEAVSEKSPPVVRSSKRDSDYAATELEDQRPNQFLRGSRL
jgi:ankyrin repeat protein